MTHRDEEDTRTTPSDEMLAYARRDAWADNALTLEENYRVPGAESIFNHALTNGLLAVGTALGMDVTYENGRTKSARKLIEDLIAADAEEELVGDSSAPPLGVTLRTLLEAVERTDLARHGRSPISRLREADVKALLDLDRLPGLNFATSGKKSDRNYIRAKAADDDEQVRAGLYLELLIDELGQDEITRRAELASGVGMSGPEDPYESPQGCPVCGCETLAVVAADDFGYGIGAGTCAVCSYTRSYELLYWLGMDAEFERQMAKDD